MATTFAKAPLVEIIVDLQWQGLMSPVAGQLPPNMPSLMFVGGQTDEFMMQFGGAAYSLGFQRSERLVPSGFPVPAGQPVYRYRPGDKAAKGVFESALLQIGPGMFSANAVPPYSSWDEFSPIVEKGIEALLATRSESEKSLPFTTVGLRYIDAFTADFLAGRTPQEFISKVLGFEVSIPEPLAAHQRKASSPSLHMQLQIPVAGDMTMYAKVGEGRSSTGDLVAMLDCQIRADSPIEPDLGKLMAALGKAREIIHDSFWKMTEDIHGIMQPK